VVKNLEARLGDVMSRKIITASVRKSGEPWDILSALWD
jgi:hypothetical protein